MVKHWHRLPREMVDAPSLKTFKVRMDGQPDTDILEDAPAHRTGFGLDDL